MKFFSNKTYFIYCETILIDDTIEMIKTLMHHIPCCSNSIENALIKV